MMMTEDVFLSDLSACLPATSLCPQWSNGKWMLVDYETESGIAGRMLYYTYYPAFHAAMRRPADEPFVNPPPVALPLGVTGRFDIHLGMHYASKVRRSASVSREKTPSPPSVVNSACRRTVTSPRNPGSASSNSPRPTGARQISPARISSSRLPSRSMARIISSPTWLTYGSSCGVPAVTAIPMPPIERAHEHDLQIYASLRFSGLKMDNYLPIHEIYAEYCLGSSIDAATWMQEGLMDHCIVHPCHSAAAGIPDPTSVSAELLAKFVEARATPSAAGDDHRQPASDPSSGRECRIYADVYPRGMPAEGYRQRAIDYYAAGIDGLSLWDTHARRTRASEWSMIRRLGHRQELEGWEADTAGLFQRTTLRTFQGITTDRAYSFTDG